MLKRITREVRDDSKRVGKNQGFVIVSLNRIGKVLYHGDMASTVQYQGYGDEPYPKPCQISSETEVEPADLAVSAVKVAENHGLEIATGKRKRGRPKGSKNKPKIGDKNA